ncbi:hypothetical protein RAS1_32810 [Phycisphaerae bacterium RAS1]|nr:hypothetical protein RAS1_32810 [Phycisphaerae bacterium RAS1]
MRVKVKLGPRAAETLAGFSDADATDFYVQLSRVREAPLKYSRLWVDAGYAADLRWFEFGTGVTKLAIFRYDALAGVMSVVRCKLAKPRRTRRAGDPPTTERGA